MMTNELKAKTTLYYWVFSKIKNLAKLSNLLKTFLKVRIKVLLSEINITALTYCINFLKIILSHLCMFY